jgi:hypothetical protein
MIESKAGLFFQISKAFTGSIVYRESGIARTETDPRMMLRVSS